MTESERKGIDVPFPFSLLLLPLLFGAALLSLPCSAVYRLIARRRRKILENQLSKKGRLIEWDNFFRIFEAGEGTVIVERDSFKSSQAWWTSDAVRNLSPYAIQDWFEVIQSKKMDPFSSWCFSQYTSPETGRAFLISSPTKEKKKQAFDVWEKYHESASERWIDVARLKSGHAAQGGQRS